MVIEINELGARLVEIERLARLESEVEHTQRDIHEVRVDIKDIKESSKNVEKAVVELAEIARTNQRIFPRIEEIENELKATNLRLAKWGGVITALIFLLTFFGSEVRTVFTHNTTSPIVQGNPSVPHGARMNTPQEQEPLRK